MPFLDLRSVTTTTCPAGSIRTCDAEISWPGFPVESGSDPEPESEPAEADPGFSSAFEDETGAEEDSDSNGDVDQDEDENGIPRRRVLH